MHQRFSRRSALTAGAALLGSLALGGCGFRLRGSFEAPFSTIYLQMTENTRFSGLLKRTIESGSNIKCVRSPKEAEAILELLSNRRGRDVLTINDAGRAREYELTLTIAFRCTAPDGYEWIESTTLSARRDLSYTESEFLSREKEEEVLYQDMEGDLIAQIVRRIEAARERKPGE
ncbi:LPS assembly lipoprotein LptE [Sutterella sp.]|uniref:LPS-assembly lipoprotein LptE n=1 Tax=Sutterella sp. TaxID=1981025 RepID=UPI0026DEFC3C|nr:LPS assembly lipoprotein LptE [Sutterella sp.]MDO5531725.1 LPS assembly lipoprotein LptE [Sutterella sp.]